MPITYKNKSKRNYVNKRKNKTLKRPSKQGKKWVTAIEKAQKTLMRTGSIQSAKASLKKQALVNARKLFGSVGKIL
jgi:3-methyladenine DNA glycosylase AlkD